MKQTIKRYIWGFLACALILNASFLCLLNLQLNMANRLDAKETPVAAIDGDTYVPYSYTGHDAYFGGINDLAEQYGGEVTMFASEEEYLASKRTSSANSANASASEGTASASNFKAKQNVKVMTTPTGTVANGNRVNSVPVANALVRFDGVPFYTDSQGTVSITLTNEVVELYVYKAPFNPYIEIIDVGTDKVVYLKQPSDDIDVYAVMLNFAAEHFNLLQQHATIKTDVLDYEICTFTVKCNLPATDYFLIAYDKHGNEVKRFYSMTGFFYDFDLSEFTFENSFAVKVHYNGVVSKKYDLQLTVDPGKFNFEYMTGDSSVASASAASIMPALNGNDNISASLNMGIFDKNGSINFSPSDVINQFILYELFESQNTSIDFGSAKLKLSYVYDPRSGTIDFSIGFNIQKSLSKNFREAQKKVEELQKKISDAPNKEYQLIRQLENEISENSEKLEELKKEKELLSSTQKELKNSYDERIASALEKNQKLKKELNLNLPKAFEVIDNQTAKNEAKDAYSQEMKALRNEAKKTNKAVKDLANKVKQGQLTHKNYKDKMRMFNDIAGLDNKNELKDALKNFYSGQSKFNFEFEVLGVFTYSIVHKSFVDVRVSAQADFSFSHAFPFVAFSVPCFFKIKVFGGFGFEFGLFDAVRGGISSFNDFLNELIIKVNAGVRVDLGVGVSGLISTSGFGQGELKIEIYPGNSIADGVSKGEFAWRAGVRLELLFFEKEWAETGSKPLWGGDASAQGYSLMARSDAGAASASEKLLFGGVYQNSSPELVQIGDKYVLVWLEDDPSRDTYNRTVLKYSVFANGSWGIPQAVFSDGKADFYPSLYSDGENVFVTWQKSSKLFTGADTVESMMQAGEIYFAQFDPASGRFDTAMRVTNNSKMDSAPRFAVKKGQTDLLTLVWQSNSDDNIFGDTGENSVWFSQFEGGVWTAPVKMFETDKIMSRVSAAISGKDLSAAVVLDMDGDMLTNDGKAFVIKNGTADVLSQSQTTSVEFGFVDDTLTLFFIDDGILMTSSSFSDAEAMFGEGEEVIASFRLSATWGDSIVFYTKVVDGVEQAFAAKFETMSSSWAYGIKLTDEAEKVSQPIGFLNGGKISCAYFVKDEASNASLCFDETVLFSAVEIKDIFLSESLSAGEENEIHLQIANTGSTVIDKLVFKVEGQVFEMALQKSLKVGEDRYFSVEAVLRANAENLIVVEAYCGGNLVAEAQQTYSTSFVDLSISAEVSIVSGKQVFTATIANKLIATDFVLNVYINGILHESKSLQIGAGKEMQQTFAFDNISESDYIVFEVASDACDMLLCDNEAGLYSSQNEFTKMKSENDYWQVMLKAKGAVYGG